jgi:hypothetical protein
MLDHVRGEARKVYQPPLWVRAAYWLAFQAPFPYTHRRDALEAARERRAIAGALSLYWFGRNLIAPVLEIRQTDRGLELVSRLVVGSAPDANRGRCWLRELSHRFAEAGLPTWQIAPYNPRAVRNLVRAANGDLIVIDLESTLITVLVPLATLPSALRRGAFPAFDDTDVDRLERYVVDHTLALARALGRPGFAELKASIQRLRRAEQSWRSNEVRVWGWLSMTVARCLDRSHPARTGP